MTITVNISTATEDTLEGLTSAVSARIKALRTGSRLSLDALSKRSGVSKGMLVEIEKGAANPSIGTLCRVASAFGVSVADLVSTTESSGVRAVPSEDIPTLWSGDRGGTARLLAGTTGPDMIELWRWVLMPGEVYEAQAHSAGTMELFHVEEGTLDLVVDKTRLVIEEGHSAVARTDRPHRYSNMSDRAVVFTMAVAELARGRTAL